MTSLLLNYEAFVHKHLMSLYTPPALIGNLSRGRLVLTVSIVV
jgi:hypothetical protein